MDLEQKILKLLSVQMQENVDRLEPFRCCLTCREVIARGGICSCEAEKGRIVWTVKK